MKIVKKCSINFGIIAAIICLQVITVSCEGKTTNEINELPASLTQTINKFYESIDKSDAETRISLFSNNAIMMPNHWTITRGKENIGDMMRSSQDYVFKIRDRELIGFGVSGDLAYTVNSYYYTWHAKQDQPQWHNTKNVHLWKVDSDGNWKLHLDIWNSNVPINVFAEE